jgi:nucleotide-binding universal stress UspA family protein
MSAMTTPFPKIGVFYDGAPGSDEALQFAAALGRAFAPESILCVHVAGRGGVQYEPNPELPDFTKLVEQRFGPELMTRTRVAVHEGEGVAEILRSARDESLDLIVVGRRLPSDEMSVGSTFTRLARKSPCSVLVAPVYARPHLSRILVPVDGSEHSKSAVETAVAMARRIGAPQAQLVLQQVYTLGYGYQYTGDDFHEAGRKLETVTREKLRKLAAETVPSDMKADTVCICSEQPARAITDLSVAMKMDLIVVGSRGLSSTAAALLGSNTERILMASPIPVLIVKRKGETAKLLAALLG